MSKILLKHHHANSFIYGSLLHRDTFTLRQQKIENITWTTTSKYSHTKKYFWPQFCRIETRVYRTWDPEPCRLWSLACPSFLLTSVICMLVCLPGISFPSFLQSPGWTPPLLRSHPGLSCLHPPSLSGSQPGSHFFHTLTTGRCSPSSHPVLHEIPMEGPLCLSRTSQKKHLHCLCLVQSREQKIPNKCLLYEFSFHKNAESIPSPFDWLRSTVSCLRSLDLEEACIVRTLEPDHSGSQSGFCH